MWRNAAFARVAPGCRGEVGSLELREIVLSWTTLVGVRLSTSHAVKSRARGVLKYRWKHDCPPTARRAGTVRATDVLVSAFYTWDC